MSGKKKKKQKEAESACSLMAELPFTNTEVWKELGCECTLAPRTTAELTYLLKRQCEAAPDGSSHLPGGGIIVWRAAELRDDVCLASDAWIVLVPQLLLHSNVPAGYMLWIKHLLGALAFLLCGGVQKCFFTLVNACFSMALTFLDLQSDQWTCSCFWW